MAESDWELGSGFALDGATATIEDVEFTHDNQLGPNACAKMTFTDIVDADGAEVVPDKPEGGQQKFTVGKNYDNNRDGTELVGQGKINENTNFGILLASIKGLFDSIEDAVEAVPNPKEAASWRGTRWTLGTIVKQTMNPSTGKIREDAQKFVFTAYHGRPENGDTPAPPTAKKAAASTTAKRVGGTGTKAQKEVNGVDADVWNKLVTLAAEYDDEDTFNDAALELAEVEQSRPAQKAIMKGLVWAAKE